MQPPVFRRRHAVLLLKTRGEVRGASKSAGEGDFCDRLVSGKEHLFCTLQPEFAYVLHGCLARFLPEHACKMRRGQVSHGSHLFDSDLFLEVRMDMLDSASYLDPFLHRALPCRHLYNCPDDAMTDLDAECREHRAASGDPAVRLGHEPLEQKRKRLPRVEKCATIGYRLLARAAPVLLLEERPFDHDHNVPRGRVQGQFLVRDSGRQGKNLARPCRYEFPVDFYHCLVVEIQDEHVRRVRVLGHERVIAGAAHGHEQGNFVGNKAVDISELLPGDLADQFADCGEVVLHGPIMSQKRGGHKGSD